MRLKDVCIVQILYEHYFFWKYEITFFAVSYAATALKWWWNKNGINRVFLHLIPKLPCVCIFVGSIATNFYQKSCFLESRLWFITIIFHGCLISVQCLPDESYSHYPHDYIANKYSMLVRSKHFYTAINIACMTQLFSQSNAINIFLMVGALHKDGPQNDSTGSFDLASFYWIIM